MSKISGIILCLAALAVAAVFLWAVFQGGVAAYWAVAIPVAVGLLGILALIFWIGWTMLTTEAEPAALPATPEKSSETKGKAS
ncbi:MAG: hypothetical protein Q8O76_02660 [Chloroflexota bacterium]|nr:hypothetical protein [Chloroflexota bacterium]